MSIRRGDVASFNGVVYTKNPVSKKAAHVYGGVREIVEPHEGYGWRASAESGAGSASHCRGKGNRKIKMTSVKE